MNLMIAELGQIALILAFLISIFQGIFPVIGYYRGDTHLATTARPAALVQFTLILFAFILLTYAHATSDFSIKNVVENSHSAKPFVYKLTGVWGNHEGSMLLWVMILSGFGACLCLNRQNKLPFQSALNTQTLAIQGLIGAAFLAFLIFTSNPFSRSLPAPADGMDLNPLLQDPGLIIHPPFLYLGYVGFSVVFSYAVAGLLLNRVDSEWARTVRPWALTAWVFLTIGIALGSWWAYYELGWGGFWAWDPVENASFMPWLIGTALIHSIRVLEKRDALKAWTVLLAIFTFSLSLIGTFLVRSGILTSVHAFAVDPERGVFILAILAFVIGGAFTVYAIKADGLNVRRNFEPFSREGAILINNVLLTTACGTVFIGTFYPLFIDIMSGEKLSVGTPFFNATFLPLAAILLLALAPGAALAWKKGNIASLRKLWPILAITIATIILALIITWPKATTAAFGSGLAAWVGGATLRDVLVRIKAFTEPTTKTLKRLLHLPRPYIGMCIAHFGLSIIVIGILGASAWRTEKIQFIQPGDVVQIAGFDVRLESISPFEGPNYISEFASFSVERKGVAVKSMVAERRFYPVRRMQTTEAAIWTTLKGDLYLTVGEFNNAAGWPLRAYYNPFVFWLWTGAGLLAVGGGVAASHRLQPMRKKSITTTNAVAEAI